MLLHNRNTLVRSEVQCFTLHKAFICSTFPQFKAQDAQGQKRGDFVLGLGVEDDVVLHAPMIIAQLFRATRLPTQKRVETSFCAANW